jgi:GGDEF domain-containing protein
MCEVSSGSRDQLLFRLMESLGNSLALHQTLNDLDAGLRGLIAYDAFAAWLPLDDRLVPGYVIGDDARLLRGLELPLTQREIAIEEPGNCGPFRTVATLPLENGHGLAGILAFYRREVAPFDESDRQVLQAIRRKSAAAISNSMRFERAERLASIDPESSLLNERALFLRLDAELARARRNRTPVGVLVCEIGVPPARWPVAAAAIRRICREDDCVARMGQAMVLVLAGFARQNLPDKQQCIESALAEHGVSVLVGAAFYPEDGAYADDLLAAAGERRACPSRPACPGAVQ